MSRHRIHLIAPAGSCLPFMQLLETSSAEALIALVQQVVGDSYEVTGDAELIEAAEDEGQGGRLDDKARAEDIQRVLSDDAVAGITALRGGAWFTRILPRIDFSVLDKRTRPVTVFGFSELTPLVNLVAAHSMGAGVYDMGPAFLAYGLKRYAELQLGLPENKSEDEAASPRETSDSWMRSRLKPELQGFFSDVVRIIDGGRSQRTITAQLLQGELPESRQVTFVGGNLCVLCTLIGSPYASVVDPSGHWLVLEEINEKLERIDRFLAHLTLAGYWRRCQGILLGDFHRSDQNLTPHVWGLLHRHLPEDRTIPILVTQDVGHVWPMSPLRLHEPRTLEQSTENCEDRWLIR